MTMEKASVHYYKNTNGPTIGVTVKPVIEFWQQAEPMLMLCNKVSKECMKQ